MVLPFGIICTTASHSCSHSPSLIHQIEADCASLGRSYVGIMQLDAHTPTLHGARVAAYLLDPMSAQVQKTSIGLPVVPDKHEQMVCDLIKRVGGRAAAVEFEQLRLEG